MPALPALAAQPQREADPVYGCRVSSRGRSLDSAIIRCVRLDNAGCSLVSLSVSMADRTLYEQAIQVPADGL
jgi:hypothetical protein